MSSRPFSGIHSEILNSILQYMSPIELTEFKRVCKAHKVKIDSPEMDVLLQPVLNHLYAIDNTIDMKPPAGKEQTAWRFKRIKQVIEQVDQNQLAEIAHFRMELDPGKGHISVPVPGNLTCKLYNLSLDPADALQTLKERNHILNAINAHLIRSKIDLSSTKLSVGSSYLTRLPQELFEDKNLQDYWFMLENLSVSNNHLQNLPKGIGNCSALKYFNCSANRIRSLPDALHHCQVLEQLHCDENQLENLPGYLGELKALRVVYCRNNQLESLPESLTDCRSLNHLDCSSNHMMALPELLGNCPLNELWCRENRIRKLPESLGHCQTLKLIECSVNLLKSIPDWAENKILGGREKMLKCQFLPILDLSQYNPLTRKIAAEENEIMQWREKNSKSEVKSTSKKMT